MAEARKDQMVTSKQSLAHTAESREVKILPGWKYKGLILGPITLPCYASPESQLILVSFVCFLCPGKVTHYVIFLQAADYVKACLTL